MLYSPALQALLRRLGLGQTLAQVSFTTDTLGTPRRVQRRPALFAATDLERITGFAPTRSLALELSRLEAGTFDLPAARLHRLRHAAIIDGNLYLGRAKHLVAGHTRCFLASLRDSNQVGGVLAANRQSHAYFGHWLTDELPMSRFGSALGQLVTTHFGRGEFAHESGYLAMHGVAEPSELPRRAHLEEVTLLGDNGMNVIQIEQLEILRETLRAKGWRRRNRRVFIRRGRLGGARSLVNEEEILAWLTTQGFFIVDPERTTAEAVARETFDAEIVLGVEGSHLAHGFVHMEERGALLVVQPPYRFNNPFKDLCDSVGQTYGLTVAEREGSGFRLDCGALASLLDRC
jgi:capsular polysaccharide biosynthesis protein